MYGRRVTQADRRDAAWLAGFLVGVASTFASGVVFWFWCSR